MFCPKLLMPWTRRNPPGQRPSFCVSTLRVYSASPQYVATSFRPPLATPWSVCSRSTSSTTPFFPSSSRSPPQLPVSRGRDQKSPPQVGGDVHGLRARGARHDQQDQTKDDCPGVSDAMYADVQTHVVLLMTHVVLLMTYVVLLVTCAACGVREWHRCEPPQGVGTTR